MNKFWMAAAGMLMAAAGANAQNAYDALTLSKTDPIMGTARYSAMGGALGALGADATVLKDNPAGLGMYRSCDLTLTPNVYITDDKSVGFDINNFAFVLNFGKKGHKRGYVTSSLGVSYNRLKNFKRYSSFRGQDLEYSMTEGFKEGASNAVYKEGASNAVYDEGVRLGLLDKSGNSIFSLYLIDNRIRYKEEGSLGEWNVSYGMNISNRFYWGVGLGFVNMDYNQTVLYDEWIQNADEGYWYIDNYKEATGSGINFKFGAIGRLTDFMRIGVAFHTPTFYSVDQYTNTNMDYNGQNDNDHLTTEIDWDETEYDLQSPLKLQGSLGFVIGKRALIGLEYQYEDYGAMRLSDGSFDYDEDKDRINDCMEKTHTFKVGTEVVIVDGFSGRLGFAYVTSPVEKELSMRYNTTYPVSLPRETMYYTGGLGYKGKSFYADFALVFKNQKEYFFDWLPYEDPISDESLFSTNIMATIGWRF